MAGIIKGLVSDGTLPTTAKQDLSADLGNPSSTVGAAVQSRLTAERAASDAKYLQGSPDLLSKLPTPYYITHRAGVNMAPEMSMEGYRIAAATGIEVLEADVQPTADGALVLIHDTTVDRTTDGTGPVSGYTLPAFLSLNSAAKIPWPRPVPPATLQQFLAEFGPQKVLQIEPKDPTTLHKMLDAAEAARVENSIQVETNNLTVAQQAVARGYEVWFFWGTTFTNPTIQTVIDAGVNYLAAAHGTSDANIQALVATGKNVSIYGVERRYDRDRYLALGVHGISSDNPTYVKANAAFRKTDSWDQGVWGQGLHDSLGVRPTIHTGGVLKVGGNNYNIIVPGEVLPVANAASTYSIDVDFGWDTLPTDTARFISFMFCAANDRGWHANSGNILDGYNLIVRASGQMAIYKRFNGANEVQVGSTVTTPALVAGQWAHMKITVSPTNITVTRTDVAEPNTITTTDTTHRGGYLHTGKMSTDGVAMYRDLVIS